MGLLNHRSGVTCRYHLHYTRRILPRRFIASTALWYRGLLKLLFLLDYGALNDEGRNSTQAIRG